MSTDHRYDVVALGEPLIEFNQVRGGDAHAWRQGYGGDTSNMAIAAARLGARVAYVTRLGDDGFGRQFRALWSAEGVALDGVATDPEAPTGVYFVTHGPSRDMRSPTCARVPRRAGSPRRTCRST